MALSAAALAFVLDDDSSSDSSTSSDSSSSDEETRELYELLFSRAFLEPQRKRPRIEGYIDSVVRVLSDEEFRRKFRVPRSVVADLCIGFETSALCPRSNNGGLPPKTAEEHVLAFLWYAANKACIRDVATCFGMAEATTFRVIERMMNYLVKMAKTVIMFPHDIEQLSAELEQVSGVPGAIGCVDECYITIRCPHYKVPSTNTDRHNFPSVTVQAVCDHKKKFLSIAVGNPSRIRNTLIFHKTRLAKKLPRMCAQGDFHILGSAAYPLRKFLLTPFPHSAMLTPRQIAFNAKLSAAKLLVEDSFVDLRERFRQLFHMEFIIAHKVRKLTLACCVLHNLCIDSGDTTVPPVTNDEAANTEWHSLAADESEHYGPLTAREAALCYQGEQKREGVMRAMDL